MQNSLVQIEYILNKFLLKGREAIGRMRGKKEKGEEKEGRLQERKQGEQHRNLGSHLFPVCNTCQVSRLHLVSCTASVACLCVCYSLITPHAAQNPTAGPQPLPADPGKPTSFSLSAPGSDRAA